MADIPITGVPSTFIVPGVYGELLFNQGPSSVGVDPRQVVFVMPMLASGGTWTANTRYRVRNESEVKTGAGAGSPLHRSIRRFLLNNKSAEVFAVPYAPTSVSTNTPADATVTWATDPTGQGKTSVTIAGTKLTVGFDADDDVTAIATRMVALVAAHDYLPVTASNTSGVMTLEAKIDGVSQGDGTVGVIRLRAEIDSGVDTTVTAEAAALGLGASQDGAEGTTTEIANLTAALATLSDDYKYYICISAWSAGAIAAATAHVQAKETPRPGFRSMVVAGYTGSSTAAATLATTENYHRLTVINQPNSEFDVADLVGNYAAVIQKWQNRDAAINLNGYNGFNQIEGYNIERDWQVPAAYSTLDWPTEDEQNDALTDGVTIIGSRDGGSYIVKPVTTRSKDATGNNDDFRSLSLHTVSGADYALTTLLATLRARYASKKLKDDQRLADGTVDANQSLARGVVTPSTMAPTIEQWADDMEAQGIFDDADQVRDTLIRQIDPDNRGRIELGFDFTVIAHLDQITVRAAENTPG